MEFQLTETPILVKDFSSYSLFLNFFREALKLFVQDPCIIVMCCTGFKKFTREVYWGFLCVNIIHRVAIGGIACSLGEET